MHLKTPELYHKTPLIAPPPLAKATQKSQINTGGILALRALCALLLDYVPREEPVFQVEESVFSRPNHRGRRSQPIGAGVEHPIPNTEIHRESGPEK